jgi:hypothetical protein
LIATQPCGRRPFAEQLVAQQLIYLLLEEFVLIQRGREREREREHQTSIHTAAHAYAAPHSTHCTLSEKLAPHLQHQSQLLVLQEPLVHRGLGKLRRQEAEI